MKTFTLLIVTFLFVNIEIIKAQKPGDLDSSFGINGKDQTNSLYSVTSVALQADGKILVTGPHPSYSSGCFTLYRYTPNGHVDTTFAGGVISTHVQWDDDNSYAVTTQGDGKILLAGTSYGNGDEFAVVRYLDNGNLDSSFGDKGKVHTIVGNFPLARSIAVQDNGKIILGGSASTFNHNHLLLARYSKNGSLDATFGKKGIASSPFSDNCYGHAVAIQQDGKIVMAGVDVTTHSFILARFTQNGKPDSTFGSNGICLIDAGGKAWGNSVWGACLVIQPDKKIVLAGTVNNTSSSDMIVVRYMPSGKPDKTFGINGKTIYYNVTASAIGLQLNGKIVLAGTSNDGYHYIFSAVRYKQTGKLDSTFGLNGKIVTDFKDKPSSASAIAMPPDGKIIIAGTADYYRSNGVLYDSRLALARYYGFIPGYEPGFATLDNKGNTELQANATKFSTPVLAPNPAKSFLNIQDLSSKGKKIIFVTDANGKLIETIQTADNHYNLNVRSYTAGIYFVKIEQDKTITSLKFAKE